jgi:hypothetical protein
MLELRPGDGDDAHPLERTRLHHDAKAFGELFN